MNQDQNQTQNPTQTSNNKGPADTVRDGALKGTIWANQGEKGVYYTVKLAKTYEDRDGNLQDSQSFSPRDLLQLAEVARRAYTRCNELRQAHGPSRNQESGARDDRPRSEAREAWEGRRDSHRPQSDGNRNQRRDYRGPSQ